MNNLFHARVQQSSERLRCAERWPQWSSLIIITILASCCMPKKSHFGFLTPSTHETFAFSKDVKLNLQIFGQGARPMLMIHGFGASLETWNEVVPILAPHFRIYRVDLKGFGLSSKPRDGQYAPTNQAMIITSLINHYNLNDLVLVGHSYGGAVAMLTWLLLKEVEAQNRISALVLLDTACYPQDFPFFVAHLRMPLISALLLKGTTPQFRTNYTLRRIFYDPSKVTHERVERYARFLRLPGSDRALISAAKQILDDAPSSLASKIPDINVRTLIIWGGNDSVIPQKHALRLNREIRNSQLKLISQCGHVPHEEKPVETASEMLTFLN
jgi:pimeloyl-ACP methyl ester carboxylesterase